MATDTRLLVGGVTLCQKVYGIIKGTNYTKDFVFYRAMHIAKRGITIACRLSVLGN